MKFLLVALNAKYIHSNPALYSLRSYAVQKDAQAKAEVEIAEYTINQQLLDVMTDIYKRQPDAAAFSCYIWNWTMMKRLITQLHKVMPDLPIWLGGPEVSFHSEQILEELPFVTGIMVGEGEETFAQLLGFYRQQEPAERTNLQQIKGLVFRDAAFQSIVRTDERELTDISKLPFLYDNLDAFQNRIIYYESSRGCPFRCSYCLSSIDKKVRLRDLSLVKKELQTFLDAKVPQVKFIDRTFNCNRTHALEIWNYILKNDNGVTNFHFEIAADLLDEEQLDLLGKMRPGLVQLEIGVQSTNEETLRAVRRYSDTEKLGALMVRIQKPKNVHIHLDLIAGLPHEGLESFRKSFNDVYRMKPEQLQLGFLKVLKGSHMEEMAGEWGIVSMDEPPYEVLRTKWISFDDVILLKKVENMVELYYNSNQFSHVLPVLERQFESPFDLFVKMADFYEENGYFANSPSRAYRYQVLLDFAAETDPKREELYRELLVFDMYLRENLKSRPAFAKSLAKWHDEILDFYQTEAQRREMLPDYEGYDAKQLQRMTHLEVFNWPVTKEATALLDIFDRAQENAAQIQKQSERMQQTTESTAILFDYKVHSPLNADARIGHINLKRREESWHV